jgi:hypothetical protein
MAKTVTGLLTDPSPEVFNALGQCLTEAGLRRAFAATTGSSLGDLSGISIDDIAKQVEARYRFHETIRVKRLKVASRPKIAQKVYAHERIGSGLTGRSHVSVSPDSGRVGVRKAAKKAQVKAPGACIVVAPSLWVRVKQEFRILICTNNKRYSTLRKQFAAIGTKSQTTIVSLFSVAIGKAVGVAAAVITPFVVLGLKAILQVGQEAYCRTGKMKS